MNKIAGFCLETIYLPTVGTKILHWDAKGTGRECAQSHSCQEPPLACVSLFLTFVYYISQKDWGMLSQKVWRCGFRPLSEVHFQ